MVNLLRHLRAAIFFTFGLLLGGSMTFEAYAETIPATVSGVTYTCALPGVGGPSRSGADIGSACDASYAAGIYATYPCPNYNPSTGACWGAGSYAGNNLYQYNVQTYCLSSSCVGGATQGEVVFNDTNTTQASTGVTGTATYSCPANQGWTLSGSSCTRADCQTGYTRDEGGVCQPPPPTCQAGEVLEGGVCKPDCNHESRNLEGQNYGGSGSYTAGGTLCVAGCEYNTNNGITGCGSSGCIFEAKVGTVTGQRCTANVVTQKTPTTRTPEETCLANKQGYITTNGTTTCVPSGTQGASTITDTSAPSTTTTGGGTTTTQQTTTVKPDGTVTQTTTTTPPSGTPTTTTTTQTKEKFCEENPNATICKQGSFGGSCTSGFICDGDGVNCAIARAKHLENCILYETSTPQSTLGQSLGNGSDPSGDLNTFKTSSVVNLPSTLDHTNPYGSSGLSDLTISVGQGGSVTIPFSGMNAILTVMGQILVALAFVAAGRIVGVY
jgi:hypothetical protein